MSEPSLVDHLQEENDKLVAFLRGLKWKSIDRDNMEYAATITTWQLDELNKLIGEKK